MTDKFPVVRKHHYVWAYYLSAWASNGDKKIWHVTPKGKVRKDSVKGLSREENFNKIHALDDRDAAFIEYWPCHGSQSLKDFHKSQLEYFKGASRLINCHIGHEHSKEYSELKNISEAIQFGIFEKTHTIIESLARPVVDELKAGNIDCLKSGKYMTSFCNFLAQQLFRTKKMKERCLESLQYVDGKPEDIETVKTLYERNWWLLSYKIALNLGSSLHGSATSDHHTLIKNDTPIEFITSDCPVINIHDSVSKVSPRTPPEDLDLYFPISPKIAYIISSTDKYRKFSTSINEKDVIFLNEKIKENSYLSIYASSQSSIERAMRKCR